jgi:hypothetical protein
MAINPEHSQADLEQAADIILGRMAKQHRTGLWGLLAIYPKDKLLLASILPALASIGVYKATGLAGIPCEKLLRHVVDSSVSILPNLLGFLLGGYTILIGFGNSALLKAATHVIRGRRISLFQMLSTIFALTIYLQSIALAGAVVAQFTLEIPLHAGPGFMGQLHDIAPIVNKIFTLSFLFLLFYSILSLKDTVVNVFSFAQRYHLTLTEDRLTDDQNARNGNGSNGLP